MVQQTSGREKEKWITQNPIVHMARKNLFLYLVMEMGFVCIRDRNTLVRSVKVAPSMSIIYGNMTAERDVEVDVFATMRNKKGFAGIVVVTSCARSHIVLCKKTKIPKYDPLANKESNGPSPSLWGPLVSEIR